MNFKEFVGIDVSKLTLDVCIHGTQEMNVFENNLSGFSQLKKWIEKIIKVKPSEVLLVFEHTGVYSYNLSIFLDTKGISFVALPGLEIKRSIGMVRGKNDKIDAKRIALYGYRRRDELKPTKLPSIEINKIKQLLTLRDQLVRQRASLKTVLKETSTVLKPTENKLLLSIPKNLILKITQEIKKIEKELESLLKDNIDLKNQFELIVSIKGVGKLMAYYTIAYTEGFRKFKRARQFASYCGVAPFPHSSGTSIRGKNRVSHLANKHLKSLLSMCAASSIQHAPEMRLFFLKKVAEGKPKLSVINIIRNKLLHRIFAIVKRGTPYVELNKFAA